jgi:hypothetical protein
LKDKITILLPLVLECLDGEKSSPVASPEAPGGSMLAPHPRITPQAASSLASSFAALDDWEEAGRPALAIPVLTRGLQRWKLRRRFVEALARYKDPAALEALASFARSEIRPGGDAGLLGEVAEALGEVAQALSRLPEDVREQNRQTCIDVLQQIIVHPDLEPRARRAAIKSKNLLTHPAADSVPAIDEAEIIANLNPFDEKQGTYSDWRIIELYAGHAYDSITQGCASEHLVIALLKAFTHEIPYARIAIARCLGQVDEPKVRAALLAELLKPSVSWDVQQACIRALDAQISAATDSGLNALRRWLILDAASKADEVSAPAARALRGLAAKSQAAEDPLVTATAFEVLPMPSAAAVPMPSIELLSAEEAPVPNWISDLIDPEDEKAAGKGWEPKYRIVSAWRRNDTGLRVYLAQTTWEQGASFHCAMSRASPYLRENADRILSAWLSRAAYIPGLASIHCIVVTRDGKVVETRRASVAAYAAGCWSISFEEQMTAVDFQSGSHDAATAAALRGFAEEFNLPADTCHVSIVSAVVEFPILNPVLIAVIRTGELSEDIRRAVESTPEEDRKEIDRIQFFDMANGRLQSELERTGLHPTSAIRLQILSRMTV